MIPRRIVLLQGHPDPDARHFRHALAGRYADGARAAGLDVRSEQVARLDFPLQRTERNILGFVDTGPVHRTLIGMVEGVTERRRARRLEGLHDLGAQGA